MGCPFCAIVSGEAAAHRIAETAEAVAFLDSRPLFEGHVLVVPRAHVPDFTSLPVEALGPFFALSQRLVQAFENALSAEGAFIALNHRVSQSVPHVHLHVVPRRKGDGLRGFFWPRQKYASEAAAETIAARLREALDALRSGPTKGLG